ncbi:MAG TPA: hypothetical protein VIU87_26215 [Mycobacterium sp.]
MIQRGDILDATTAGGTVVQMRALDRPVRGRDFPVVWVCTEDEWVRSNAAGDEADGIPWPLDAVKERQSEEDET